MNAKALVLSVTLCIPAVAFSADNPDASFYKNAAEAGIAEVDAGNLAQQKSSDPKVQQFAAMMVKDHSAANDKLKALASTKGIDLPSSASVGEQATQAKLKMLTGETFDHSYIKGQISAHADTLKLLRKEIDSGQDPDARAFAKSVMPTVQAHMKAIRALAASEGISK